ncbi:MAG: hypothetical protein LC797_02215 [Chloroflexi bacterium]|nr:hypothetical protein [Chloroflexota bacterium]
MLDGSAARTPDRLVHTPERWESLVLGSALLVLLVISAASLTTGQFWQTDARLPAPWCNVGEVPGFYLGFGALAQAIGDVMGAPIECEHGEPASGDTLQATTTGIAVYRWCTNTPSFTRDQEHWLLTAEGLVHWTGSADPPRPLAIVRTPDLRHLCPT